MKLIDLLVRELPKHGGWPEGAIIAVDYLPVQMGTKLVLTDKGAFFRSKSNERVTREQYEAALAASQRCVHEWIPSEGRTSSGVLCRKCGDYDGPGEYEKMKESNSQVWDGEGLPPVGCECESRFVLGGKWFFFRCVAVDCGIAFGWAGKDAVTLDKGNYEFRPIRSEAEKRRDEAIAALKKLKPQLVGELAGYLYDEIAAGKIPHIRIE
ncbi:hypothetical protein AAAW61_003808 [Cronobacter sakazakii]